MTRPVRRWRRTRATALAALLALGTLAPAATAQDPREPEGGPGRRKPGELLEAVRFWRMAEVMQLDEEQTAQSMKRVKALREAERGHRQERKRALEDLRLLLKGSDPDRGAIETHLEDLAQSDRAFCEERVRLRAELLAGFSPEQRARYYLFEEQFPREVQRLMRRAGARDRIEERMEEKDLPGPALPGGRRRHGGRG